MAPNDLPELKPSDNVVVVNDTTEPDSEVLEAVKAEWVDRFGYAGGASFRTYNSGGSAFARAAYTTPGDVFGEIELARDMIERDDDVAAAVDWMVAAAFEGGMENTHEDERTAALFDAIAANANLDHVFQDLYLEYLTSGQVNTVQLYTRKTLEYREFTDSALQSELVSAPRVGILPAENVRVIGNDMFGTGQLGYIPESEKLASWLRKYFDPETSAGQKRRMAMQDRVSAAMFTGFVDLDPSDEEDDLLGLMSDGRVWLLNPRMVHRSTAPKGNRKYPRPFLTRNFGLLEAKRLLNILDWSLLQGGASYIVVAKIGAKDKQGNPKEIADLTQQVARATKAGIMVGDGRLSFEVITPKLDNLLSPQKRRLLGRKLTMAMLRTPEHGTEEPGAEGMKAEQAEQARVISSDRRRLVRHVERAVYAEVVKRNPSLFNKGAPGIWMPKVVLGENQFFLDIVKTLGDRGLISRQTFAAVGGFDLKSEMTQRQREIDAGIDELTEVMVPHSSPNMGPQDSGGGRPLGATNGSKPDPFAPKRTITQNPGETVKTAQVGDRTIRVGDKTLAIASSADSSLGRVHRAERDAIAAGEPAVVGTKVVVPVRSRYELQDLRAINLEDGARLIVGRRKQDRALLTAAVVFRDRDGDIEAALDRVDAWGFDAAGTAGS